ncbi:MAG: hypothetical protein MUF15_27830 [Acidobacteria bacterium]|jgi:hypothetical protein|nr:hypothetical protein [Acidobacteriota bacterium]
MMRKEPCLTVILPCAGEGNRLGLTTPKELYEIVPGKRLIDFSLDHINAWSLKCEKGKKEIFHLRVVVVIRPWKREVAEYAAGKLAGIKVESVLFNDNYIEWPGSVYSAAPFFSAYNLVLLPDSYLCLCDRVDSKDVCFNHAGKTLIELILEALENHNVVFGAVACTDPSILKRLGAMKVESGKVTAFQDKPRENLGQFNRFWGCYGFRGEYGGVLYDFLTRSVGYQPVSLAEQPFYPPGSVPIYSYLDLGTWDNIREFQSKY